MRLQPYTCETANKEEEEVKIDQNSLDKNSYLQLQYKVSKVSKGEEGRSWLHFMAPNNNIYTADSASHS